MLRISNT